MAERITYSTQDFVLVNTYDQNSFEFGGYTIVLESALFRGDGYGVASFRYAGADTLRKLNHIIHDLEKGITVFYVHNSWGAPFDKMGFGPDPNGPYKAVIHLSSESRGDVNYGTFWYDQEGQLKAIDGGAITQGQWDSPDAPTLKFRRTPSDDWQVFRLSGIQEPFFSYALKRKIVEPEDVEILNGQEVELDEMVYSLTDDAKRFRFNQRTLTGHRQKTIEVPSMIDISRWATVLNTLEGGWTKTLTEFPTGVELLV